MFVPRFACRLILAASLLLTPALLGCSDRSSITSTGTSTGASVAPVDEPVSTASSPAAPASPWAAESSRFEPLGQRSGAADRSALAPSTTARFALLDPKVTGVDFVNVLDLEHPMKHLYISGFACGGVVVGDVDGDDRPDLFLVSGPGRNRLYRQVGDFAFEEVTGEEVTERAGIDGGGKWGTGAAMVDIDNDGDLDIYVCNYDSPNHLFVNDGTGAFREAAAEFGLDLVDACLMPAFCDYDCDGDLDLYVLTNRYYRAGGRPKKRTFAMRDGRPYMLKEFEKYYAIQPIGGGKYEMDFTGRSDYLLRNNGDGTFTETSIEAGVTQPGHGLSITWWDCNHDGWPDAYVGNDFNDPDHLYRNNGDGTFTDVLRESIPHTSWFSMGADFGDLNGDGLLDLLVADMSATTHYAQKTTMGAMSAAKLAKVMGPPPQIMKNALYLSSGTDRFFEAAELAGLADSDWTWAIKLADFDNDGRTDVFISNGVARSFTHSDHPIDAAEMIGRTGWDLSEKGPTRPEQNLAYRNAGDLKFEDVSQAWGLDRVSMSYATAYADLDRDGDLDLVVVNLDEPVSIYRNDSREGNRLLIALRGTASNRYGIGTTVTIETASGKQVRILSPHTGFLSSNEPLIHFGLGKEKRVARLIARWPSGRTQTLTDIKANQRVTLVEPSSNDSQVAAPPPPSPHWPTKNQSPWYQAAQLGASVVHRETEHDDFSQQPLLPNRLSQLGPGVAVADYDGDGDDDFYVGGASGYAGHLMVNLGNGRFRQQMLDALNADKACEDMGAVWLDADGDGDADLYVVSGGVEANWVIGVGGDKDYRDRLYLNDGQGQLTAAPDGTLPDLRDSGSSVVAADFDRDGDLDLFVGSRVIPGDYPTSPSSRLLENRDGQFVDVTQEVATPLLTAGLVTGAVWTDVDDDGWIDLMLTTEWGPVRLLRNEEGNLVEQTAEAGLAELTGWWNGIAARDLDGDGDIDYVATNFGLNTKYHATPEKPALLYYGDFDGTGVKQLVEAEYEDSTLFPVRGKSCSTRAMPHLAGKFDTYHKFALATIVDIYTPKCLSESEKFSVTTLESGAFINDGTGKFTFRPLPRLAQIAPSFGLVLTEVNGDGHPDLYLAQNFFTAQSETGRMDGGMSLLLLGKGDGTFQPVAPGESGLLVTGDATAVAECDLRGDKRGDLLIAVNDDHLLAFENRLDEPAGDANEGRILRIGLEGLAGNLHAVGARVTVRLAGGTSQTAEVSAGHGYLSQSTPVLSFALPAESKVDQIEVRWPDGSQTTHEPTESLRQSLSKSS